MITFSQLFVLSSFIFTAYLFFFRVRRRELLYSFTLFIYHAAFSYVFYLMASGKDVDTVNYYNWAVEGWGGGFFGSEAVVAVVALVRFFLLDYDFVYLFFSSISGLSFVYAYNFLANFSLDVDVDYAKVSSLTTLRFLFLIPGLHFWTGAIGKDSLMVLAYVMMLPFFFGGRALWCFLLGVLIALLVRPHVGGVILLVFFLYFSVKIYFKLSNIAKIFALSAFFAIALFLLDVLYGFLISYVQKYSAAGFVSLLDFLDARQDVYSSTGSGLDLSSYSVFAKVLIFLLGFHPASMGGAQLLVLLEGLVLIYILSKVFLNVRSLAETENFYTLLASLFFLVLLVFMLSSLSGNLGLIARQRIMVYIPLIFIYFYMRHCIAKLSLIKNSSIENEK